MTEREWREATDMKPSTIGLFAVVAVGLVLRIWNIGGGIPSAVGTDEAGLMSTVVGILKSGDFNPHVFEFPTGYIYAQLGVAVARFLVGATRQSWHAVEQVGPADFYLWGRVTTALLGASAVLLLHQAGMRWGARHALLGAGLLAVMPIAVRESHVALTDTPLVFCVVLTLLLSLRAVERPSAAAFALAGGAAGLSAGVSYQGCYAMAMPIAAALMAGRGRTTAVGSVLTSVAAGAGAFIATTPYALLDLPRFLDGFGSQARVFMPEGVRAEAGWLGCLAHLQRSFGWPASILGASGLVLSAVRTVKGPGHPRWVLLLIFPLVFAGAIAGRPALLSRDVLPIVPFVCLWAAIATISGVSLLRRFDIPRAARTTLIAALTVGALLPPAIGSINWVRQFGKDSRPAPGVSALPK